MGLSVKWASFNLGAKAPEEIGNYYAWGELGPKSEYTYENYKYRKTDVDITYTYQYTKYIHEQFFGDIDNKTVLEPKDDAAHVKFGSSWRMPTDEEWTDLRTKCEWTWTSDYNGTGVSGRIVTATNGNSIFLPAAGFRRDADLRGSGSFGFYWSSSLCTDYPTSAWGVLLQSDGVARYGFGFRYLGFSVRPVTE